MPQCRDIWSEKTRMMWVLGTRKNNRFDNMFSTEYQCNKSADR